MDINNRLKMGVSWHHLQRSIKVAKSGASGMGVARAGLRARPQFTGIFSLVVYM